jgi:membrane protease YdiL (CAAX protease family)
MQTLFLALLLAAVFSLLVPRIQSGLQRALDSRPTLIWAVPFFLTAIFAMASSAVAAFSVLLSLLVLIYSAAPVACVYRLGRAGKTPHVLDFLAILLLWLPLEFAAGAALVPRPAQGFLHSVAYGIAILLALILFVGYRQFPGMRYGPPRTRRDLWLPFAAFGIVAPVLAVVGVAIGFIPPPHLPVQSGGRMAAAAGVIFAGTALPEEILFRALIQNLLMLRFGANTRVLLVASFIFGCAHLDNGPQPTPNWRYMILATVAGFAYGKVFVMASTVLSSAALHTLVDWTKHFFF